ncbi:MAG: GAF domain-containing protein [Actinomycetota bacterium]
MGHRRDPAVAHRARTLVSADLAAVVFPGSEPGVLAVRVADGVRAEALLGVTFAAEGSISQEVMRTGRPLVFRDVATDQRFGHSVVSLAHLGPALFVPLAVGNRIFGTLSLRTFEGAGPSATWSCCSSSDSRPRRRRPSSRPRCVASSSGSR